VQRTAISDVEAELFEQLTRIRAAVAGEVTDAAGVAAVRSALLRLFDGFTLRRDIPDRAHVELIDTRWIEPLVSEKAVPPVTTRSYGRYLLANRLNKRKTITQKPCSCSTPR
jgi:hypothetical protein